MLIFFIVISLLVSYIDIKSSLIPDKVILPSILLLFFIKWYTSILLFSDLIAIIIVLIIFMVPIILNMSFGGGDLRFGVFCALFVGLESVGYFVLFAGVIHLLVLFFLQKKSFGFAPAMSLSTLLVYSIG